MLSYLSSFPLLSFPLIHFACYTPINNSMHSIVLNKKWLGLGFLSLFPSLSLSFSLLFMHTCASKRGRYIALERKEASSEDRVTRQINSPPLSSLPFCAAGEGRRTLLNCSVSPFCSVGRKSHLGLACISVPSALSKVHQS